MFPPRRFITMQVRFVLAPNLSASETPQSGSHCQTSIYLYIYLSTYLSLSVYIHTHYIGPGTSIYYLQHLFICFYCRRLPTRKNTHKDFPAQRAGEHPWPYQVAARPSGWPPEQPLAAPHHSVPWHPWHPLPRADVRWK
jgi:hypothetical protein